MPVPVEYQRATELFYDFLNDVKDESGLVTTHQCYTMVQGVLQTFRRRLTIKEAILFANVLPPVLRAIFVTDWDVDEPSVAFTDMESMITEVRSLRSGHNFSTDNSIREVARALNRHVDRERFSSILEQLPEGSQDFWGL